MLEMKVEKKPYKVTDRLRIYRKGIMAATLRELLEKGGKTMKIIYKQAGAELCQAHFQLSEIDCSLLKHHILPKFLKSLRCLMCSNYLSCFQMLKQVILSLTVSSKAGTRTELLF